MLSEESQEQIMIAILRATDEKGRPVRIPMFSMFTDEALMRDFGWTKDQVARFHNGEPWIALGMPPEFADKLRKPDAK